jgi:HEAT repeat protein
LEEIPMTAALALISPFMVSDLFGRGTSDEAETVRQAQGRAFLDVHRGRALPPHLTALSPEARVAVDARWPDVCEAMFEFLAEHYPAEMLRLVSSTALTPPALTFAAELAGRIDDSQAVRTTLTPLLEHESPLVREGAIYGLRDHVDDIIVKRLTNLATTDPSPAIRQAARDTLDDL